MIDVRARREVPPAGPPASRRHRLAAFLMIAAFAVACGGKKATTPPAAAAESPAKALPPLPTIEEAAAIIEGSSDLGELDFTSAAVTIPMKTSQMNAPQHENAELLAKAGWLSLLHGGAVELTKGKDDPRFLVRPNGFLDVVPIAKKKMGPVSALRRSSDGCDVDFTWSWIPTAVGEAFGRGTVHEMFDKPHRATATLLRSGDTWSVLRIRAAQ